MYKKLSILCIRILKTEFRTTDFREQIIVHYPITIKIVLNTTIDNGEIMCTPSIYI